MQEQWYFQVKLQTDTGMPNDKAWGAQSAKSIENKERIHVQIPRGSESRLGQVDNWVIVTTNSDGQFRHFILDDWPQPDYTHLEHPTWIVWSYCG